MRTALSILGSLFLATEALAQPAPPPIPKEPAPSGSGESAPPTGQVAPAPPPAPVAAPVPSASSGRAQRRPARHGPDRRLVFSAGVGAYGCTDEVCEDRDTFMGTHFHLLYRASDYIAVGCQAALGFLQMGEDLEGQSMEVFVGWEFRFLLPVRTQTPLDFWASLALGWGRKQEKLEATYLGEEMETHWDAFALSAGIGLDISSAGRQFGFGPSFWVFRHFPEEMSGKIGSQSETVEVKLADVGIGWLAGAHLNVSF